MQQGILSETSRIILEDLKVTDNHFILELLNTEGWIRFIGERNIKTPDEAATYIKKIQHNPVVQYYVIRLKASNNAIGIISFIKRDYLSHHDIGFALLPAFEKKGYAHEAAEVVLKHFTKDIAHSKILATTVPDNTSSIALLKKLGFSFEQKIKTGNTELNVFAITRDKFLIDQLTKTFFSVFTNVNSQKPDWEILYKICIPETIIIKKERERETIYNLDAFVEPRKKILADGTLNNFEEKEISAQTLIGNNIAQRFSYYEKSGVFNHAPYSGKGHKIFQFLNTSSGWKINAISWEDED